jgi:hypothetical protein
VVSNIPYNFVQQPTICFIDKTCMLSAYTSVCWRALTVPWVHGTTACVFIYLVRMLLLQLTTAPRECLRLGNWSLLSAGRCLCPMLNDDCVTMPCFGPTFQRYEMFPSGPLESRCRAFTRTALLRAVAASNLSPQKGFTVPEQGTAVQFWVGAGAFNSPPKKRGKHAIYHILTDVDRVTVCACIIRGSRPPAQPDILLIPRLECCETTPTIQ